MTIDGPGAHGAHSVGGVDSADQDNRSLGQIVGDIANDLGDLVRNELALARTELKAEAAKAGKGAGMLGGAGVAGLLFLIMISHALVYLLTNFDWLPTETAYLIVALIWGAIAAVLAMQGRKKLKEADPTLPTTQRTLKEDARWAQEQKKSS